MPNPRVAQNGIQISRGAVATVTGSTISDHQFSGTTGEKSTGFLLFEAGGGTTIASNNVSNNDIGINDTALGPTSITGNTFTNNLSNNVVIGQGATTVSGNTMTGSDNSLLVVSFLAGTRDTDGELLESLISAAANSVATISGNTITGANLRGIWIMDQSTPVPIPKAAVTNNVITNNGKGVVVGSSTAASATVGNLFSQNSIFGNTGVGIDLADDGVTPNDSADPDIGPNGLQNFPVLVSASSSASGTVIAGTLNAIPNMSHRIEFFASSAANPSGFGEGQTFLGFINVTTDASGNASFTFNTPIGQPDGAAVSATATDAAQNTSEFSQVVFVELTPALPGLVCEVTTLNVPGGAGTVKLVDDADNPGTGALVVTGTSRSDVIVVEPRPINRAQLRVLLNGRMVSIVNRNLVQHIVVFAGAGNDTVVVSATLTTDATLFGGVGNDVLIGGAGKDGIDGEGGNDHLFGGWSRDTICGGNGIDFVYGQGGNDVVGGDAGNDHVFGEGGNDLVLGGDGNDFVYGGLGNDQVFGQAGSDLAFGEAGLDTVVGGDGNDKVFGGSGRDVVIGGLGADQLYGEADDDILISGSTAFDEDQDALFALLVDWNASASYNVRVNKLITGSGSSGIILDDTTVFNDGAVDSLFGGGGLDLFIIGPRDLVRDRTSGERVLS